MFELLKSFTAVLEEFAVSHGRAKKAALCAAEGLMIVSNAHMSVPLNSNSNLVGGCYHQSRYHGKCHGNYHLDPGIHRDYVGKVSGSIEREASFPYRRYRECRRSLFYSLVHCTIADVS